MNESATPVSIAIPYRLKTETQSFFLWGQKRQESGILNGRWEFPGGKIEPNEGPLDAVRREYFEEVGLMRNEADFQFGGIYDYTYKDRKVLLFWYLIEEAETALSSSGWREGDVSGSSDIPEANREILQKINIYFKEKYQWPHPPCLAS